MDIRLTETTEKIIDVLSGRGYDALASGSCVRDVLAGREISQPCVVTNAPPSEISRRFANCKTSGDSVDTFTVSLGGSTVRIRYTTSKDRESLLEAAQSGTKDSEFTIDTLLSDGKEVFDRFGGVSDIENKILRTVGDPDKCCKHDPRIILKTVMYVSELDFLPEEKLDSAVHKNRSLVKRETPDTLRTYFYGILTGDNTAQAIKTYVDVISEFIPYISDGIGFDQRSKYHCFDVFDHTLKALEVSDNDLIVRLSLFFHDIGKPYTYTFDGKYGHFRGHNKKSAEIARNVLRGLNADRHTVNLVSTLVFVHDMKSSPTSQNAEKLIARYGIVNAKRLLEIQRSDILAHHPAYRDTSSISRLLAFMDKAVEENKCLSVRQLDINGYELNRELGIKAEDVARIQLALLFAVIDNNVKNKKPELKRYALSIITHSADEGGESGEKAEKKEEN